MLIEPVERVFEKDTVEFRASRRWQTGIIITCTLAGYLSALIHFTD